MKKFRLFLIFTLVATLFVGVVPASAKVSKATIKKTKASAERLNKHCGWSGMYKETTYKDFGADTPATYNFAVKMIVNAANNAPLGIANSDKWVIYNAEDSMAFARGMFFSIASQKANKKKAGEILEVFSDGMYEKFDGTEYVSKKWLFSVMEAFKNGKITYDKDKATRLYNKVKDTWSPLYDSPGKGVLTRLEVINIVYDTFVMEFIA